MTELETLFNQQKAELEQLSKPFEEMKAEKDRTEKTLMAFKNELQEMQDKAESDLSVSKKISEEEYLNLRNGTTGLKARIEYHEAKLEEQELELQREADNLFYKRKEAIETRAIILREKANNKLNDWLNKNKADLSDIFLLFYHSQQFKQEDQGSIIYKLLNTQIKEFITKEVFENIPDKFQLEEKYRLHNPFTNFVFISPTKRHYESFKPQGFSKLLDNVKNTKE